MKLNHSAANRRICLAVCFTLVGLTSGCGQSREKPAPVTGIVTYQGKPVEGARVMFYPQGSRPAVGTTDAEGRYTMLTWEPGDGVLAGESVVCVAKMLQTATPDSPYTVGKSVLPEKYLTPSQSPLRANVTVQGPNNFDFALE